MDNGARATRTRSSSGPQTPPLARPRTALPCVHLKSAVCGLGKVCESTSSLYTACWFCTELLAMSNTQDCRPTCWHRFRPQMCQLAPGILRARSKHWPPASPAFTNPRHADVHALPAHCWRLETAQPLGAAQPGGRYHCGGRATQQPLYAFVLGTSSHSLRESGELRAREIRGLFAGNGLCSCKTVPCGFGLLHSRELKQNSMSTDT